MPRTRGGYYATYYTHLLFVDWRSNFVFPRERSHRFSGVCDNSHLRLSLGSLCVDSFPSSRPSHADGGHTAGPSPTVRRMEQVAVDADARFAAAAAAGAAGHRHYSDAVLELFGATR